MHRVVFEHVSCYDNFVETNAIGIPKYYYHYISLMHLEKMLRCISHTLRQMDSDVLFKMLLLTETDETFQEERNIENGSAWQYDNMSAERKRMLIKWQEKIRLHKYPQTLVAFSKGSVVLNQFVNEFHYARGLEPKHQDSRFIERIRDMYWLDSGNCGRQVYLTSKGPLRTLSALKIHIHVHVSKYMTEDKKRPWIKEQLNEFLDGINAAKGSVAKFCHPSSTADLNSHFSVLLRFKHMETYMNNIDSPLDLRLTRERPPAPEPPASCAPPPAPPRPRHMSPKYPKALLLLKSQTSPHLQLRIVYPKTSNPVSTPGATHFRRYFHNPPMHYEQIIGAPRETLSSNQMPISAQIASYSRVGTSDCTPREYSHLLMNEVDYTADRSLRHALQTNYNELYTSTMPRDVVALPDNRNPLRIHVYSSENETYVPTVNNHDLNSNTNDESEEPRPGGPGRASSNDDSHTSESSDSDDSASDSDSRSGAYSSASSRISSRSGRSRQHVVYQRAAPRSTLNAQSDVAQNSVAPRPGTSSKVRARDEDDERPCRYNLRKRIKRSYDENQCH